MNRISSLTEYALLNRWALDLFSPTAFEKLEIDSISDSALKTLRDSKQNPYSNLKNRSLWYLADKFFLLTPFKVTYISCVTLILSRLGVVLNGGLTVYSYIHYKLAPYGKENQAWEKTQNYFYAFFADLGCAMVGYICTKITVEFTFYALHFARIGSFMGKCNQPLMRSTLCTALSVAAVFFSASGLICLQHPDFASQFFAKAEDRVGMYLSLSLRKNLGLVGQNGALLNFSSEDQLQYTMSPSLSFYGKNYEGLISQILNAEYELIETVNECNQVLPASKKISFQYPFNGAKISYFLEDYHALRLANAKGSELLVDADCSLYQLISKLRSLQLKIDFLKTIVTTALKLTVEHSFSTEMVLAFCQIQTPKLQYIEPSSHISEINYKKYFSTCSSQTESAKTFKPKPTTKEFWTSVQINPINPSLNKRPSNDDLFNQFEYDIAVNKWWSSNAMTPRSFQELLGLTKDSTYQEFAQKKRKYKLAIHPDKNRDKENADELFKHLIVIIKELDQEYSKGTA